MAHPFRLRELARLYDRSDQCVCRTGMLLSSQFNVNYFAISEVDQWFTDFADEYSNIGVQLTLLRRRTALPAVNVTARSCVAFRTTKL